MSEKEKKVAILLAEFYKLKIFLNESENTIYKVKYIEDIKKLDKLMVTVKINDMTFDMAKNEFDILYDNIKNDIINKKYIDSKKISKTL